MNPSKKISASRSRRRRYVLPEGEHIVSTIRSSLTAETAANLQFVRERTSSREPIGRSFKVSLISEVSTSLCIWGIPLPASGSETEQRRAKANS